MVAAVDPPMPVAPVQLCVDGVTAWDTFALFSRPVRFLGVSPSRPTRLQKRWYACTDAWKRRSGSGARSRAVDRISCCVNSYPTSAPWTLNVFSAHDTSEFGVSFAAESAHRAFPT